MTGFWGFFVCLFLFFCIQHFVYISQLPLALLFHMRSWLFRTLRIPFFDELPLSCYFKYFKIPFVPFVFDSSAKMYLAVDYF
jgi:hypothetical protein